MSEEIDTQYQPGTFARRIYDVDAPMLGDNGAWERGYWHGQVHAAEICKEADAQIAALTERLRTVEAERDASDRELDVFGSQIIDLQSQLSALRAELQRKDAALKAALTLDDLNTKGSQ